MLDTRRIETEPHPKHPFGDSDGVVDAVCEPDHRQQETAKTPDGE